MKQYSNFSVLPFYTDIRLQNHRRSYAYGEIFPLVMPANNIIPFQFARDARPQGFTRVALYDIDGRLTADITQEMIDTGLQIVREPIEGTDIILYPGTLPMSTNIFDGTYYLTISDGVEIWYSEMFVFKHEISDMLLVEWYDVENFVSDAGIIVYQNPRFVNKLYLCTELGKPEYPFEEEVEKRDGYVFPIKQITEKTYKCTILAPEYLCDAMRFIRMSDYVRVTDKYGRKYNCDTFLITPKWQTQGDLASVEIEFETDTVSKKIGRGVIVTNKGDFNDDYNDDYNNQ